MLTDEPTDPIVVRQGPTNSIKYYLYDIGKEQLLQTHIKTKTEAEKLCREAIKLHYPEHLI